MRDSHGLQTAASRRARQSREPNTPFSASDRHGLQTAASPKARQSHTHGQTETGHLLSAHLASLPPAGYLTIQIPPSSSSGGKGQYVSTWRSTQPHGGHHRSEKATRCSGRPAHRRNCRHKGDWQVHWLTDWLIDRRDILVASAAVPRRDPTLGTPCMTFYKLSSC